MGDRSPKSKQRDQKQKNFAKATGAAQAKSKQDNQSRFPQPGGRARSSLNDDRLLPVATTSRRQRMPAVSNKTQKPLSVPLPGGKTLHLGPGKTGQISAKAADHARLKKLIEGGELEMVDDAPGLAAGPAYWQEGPRLHARTHLRRRWSP